MQQAQGWAETHQRSLADHFYRTQHQLDVTRVKRQETQMDNLKVKMFLNVKWSILKDKKQEFEALIQKKLAIRVLCSSWLKQILNHYCLKFVAETFQ